MNGTDPQLTEFGKALLFLVGGILFVAGGYAASQLLSPNRPSPEKLTPYECGEEPLGSSWVQFNMRFYSMGLIFLIFDVELLLLFPWATVFAKEEYIRAAPEWGIVSAAEAFIFIAILLVGLAYIWAKGDIDWVKPAPVLTDIKTAVPDELYRRFNETTAFGAAAPNATEPESKSKQ